MSSASRPASSGPTPHPTTRPSAQVVPGQGPVVLLVDGDGVWARRATVREQVRARVHAVSLDRALAQGVPPETDVALALRAQHIARMENRRALARTVERLIRAAVPHPHHVLTERPSMAVLPRVAACRDDLERLIEHLLAPAPVSARGVAAVSLLLRDGAGPLYRYEAREDLGDLVRRTVAGLDPTLDWPA